MMRLALIISEALQVIAQSLGRCVRLDAVQQASNQHLWQAINCSLCLYAGGMLQHNADVRQEHMAS